MNDDAAALRQRLAAAGMTMASSGLGLCRGCAELDRCQLGVLRERLVGNDAAIFDATCPINREGAHGVAHGGWIADVFDESLGRLLTLAGRFAVTRELRVRFLRPVPIVTPLELYVSEAGRRDGGICVVGELRLRGGVDTLATADAVFVPRKREAHLERFVRWLAASSDTGNGDGEQISAGGHQVGDHRDDERVNEC